MVARDANKKKHESPSKSRKLRKYGIVYEACLKKTQNSSSEICKKAQNPRPSKRDSRASKNCPGEANPKTRKKTDVQIGYTPEKKKKLTEYQKYVKKESAKAKYRHVSPKTRMKNISREWKKSKAHAAAK